VKESFRFRDKQILHNFVEIPGEEVFLLKRHAPMQTTDMNISNPEGIKITALLRLFSSEISRSSYPKTK
jgi:hypothetical protein